MKESGKGKGRTDRRGKQDKTNNVVFIDDLSAASLRRVRDLTRAGKRIEVDSPLRPRLKGVEESKWSKRKPSPLRLSKKDKENLAKRIKDSALEMIRAQGAIETVSGGKVISLDTPAFSIAHTTPFSGFRGVRAPYGLDIWHERLKVFSVWWEPFEIVAFRYGDWMNVFVPGSFEPYSDSDMWPHCGGRPLKLLMDATLMDIHLSSRPGMFERSTPAKNNEEDHDGN